MRDVRLQFQIIGDILARFWWDRVKDETIFKNLLNTPGIPLISQREDQFQNGNSMQTR